MWIASLLLLFAAYEDNYRAGLRALSQNNLEEARLNLESASQSAPGNSRVWIALAQTYWKLHDLGKANEAAEKAERFANEEAPILRLVAFYYSESGQPVKSCDMQTLYALTPSADSDAPRRAIECYLQAQAPERAFEAAARAGKNWEKRADVRIALAKACVQLQDWKKAGEEFQVAIRLNPYEESYRFEYANSLLQRQRFEDAALVLEDAKKVFAKSPQIEIALGAAYYGLRRFPDAAASFQRTIALDPDVEQPYLFLGKMLDQIPEQAKQRLIPLFEAYEKSHPESYAGYFVHAKALAGKPSEAEALFRKAIALNGGAADPHYEFGILLERTGRFQDAAKEFRAAAERSPNDPATHYHLARLYDRLGEPELAIAARERHKKLMDSSQ